MNTNSNHKSNSQTPPSRAIIVFLRNPTPGKVKTRLAADVGNEKALQIYSKLVDHTLNTCQNFGARCYLFYDQVLPEHPQRKSGFQYRIQQGNDLGERMYAAFKTVFDAGVDQAVIIGSDCADLSEDHLHQAFEALQQNDAVVGPAKDGGYYLLGLTKLHEAIFAGKSWSTNTVYAQTIRDLAELSWTFGTLKALRDIDTLADLQEVCPEWLNSPN
ncbi:MAG: TIGR04282 family arsenosugar biosynthesis glycosyltransferase [Balneolales bacterium]|nr:TIGR04282 family arsenosugar biosynthesis glycosyltransferase [Balneolales bacterium]